MRQEQFTHLRKRCEEILQQREMKHLSLRIYHSTWNKLATYMSSLGITMYSEYVGKDFLKTLFPAKDFNQYTAAEKRRLRSIEVLDYVLNDRPICKRKPTSTNVISLEGEVGDEIITFLDDLGAYTSEANVAHVRKSLALLHDFLKEERCSLKDVSVPLLVKFIQQLHTNRSVRDVYVRTRHVKRFLEHLCKDKKLSDNRERVWGTIMKMRPPKEKKLPSSYSEDEVNQLIASIDRAGAVGKRNYAIILLAYRYGLRSSDIIGLRFSNIDWEKNEINLIQKKTKHPLSFPLSEEVGLALIDYIKNGRPQSQLPYVFLCHHAPATSLTTTGLSNMVAKQFQVSGVKTLNKHKGAHCLRHSFATRLLEEQEPYPVISEALGHRATETTMHYLRIDQNQLRKCALDVPFVSPTFYKVIYEYHKI